MTTSYKLRGATPLKWLGGQIDIRVEVDTGLAGAFGLWDSAQWDVDLWGQRDPAWADITPFCETIQTNQGTQTWGNRFEAGSMSVLVSNTDGRFTPDSGVNAFHLPFVPGRRIRVVAIPDPDHTDQPEDKVPLFTGFIDSMNDSYDEGGYLITTTLTCLDYMSLWGQHNPTALEDATGVQSTDERVHAALDRMNWPEELRDIQEGVHTMQTSHLAQSTLEECARAADAEGGQFFCSQDGKATFKARDWLDTDPRSIAIQGYLGYDPEDIDLAAPVVDNTAMVEQFLPNWDRARVVNLVEFARVGSTMQMVEDEDSQSVYDVRSYRRTDLENNDDAEVLFLAQRFLDRFKDARLRFASLTISAVDDPDNADRNRLMWDTQFGDLWAVTIRTPYGWNVTRGVKISGISHTITANDWSITFRLDDIVGEGELPPPPMRNVETIIDLTVAFQATLDAPLETVEEITTSLPIEVDLSGELRFVVRPWESVQTSLPVTIDGSPGELDVPPIVIHPVSTSLPLTLGMGGQLAGLSTRASVVASHTPVAWWGFNSAAETPDFGEDLSGNAHHLAHTGPAGSESGGPIAGTDPPFGTADGYMAYDGVNDYSIPASAAALQLRQDTSIEVWVRPTETTSSLNRYIASIRSTTAPSADRDFLGIYWRPEDDRFIVSSGAGYTLNIGSGLTTTWYHIVVTIEWEATSQILKAYLNGSLVGTRTVSALPVDIPRSFNIGRRDTAGQYFQGHISEMAIYPKVLTDAEVAALYAASY
jgi:Concanavalin A-like lectin/glucanases superfamily